MKIRLEESVSVKIDGQPVDAIVEITFHGSRTSNLQEVTRQVANALLQTRTAERVPPTRPDRAPAPPASAWEAPELHAKAMKSVHRVVRAIGDAGGKGLNVQDICKRARISSVPAYRMLKDDHPQGRYAARYLRASRIGRVQVIDLTPEGRQLASLIRAGRVPA